MLASKPARLVIIAVAALVALVLLLYPTDEAGVRESAEALLEGANQGDAALASALRRYAVPQVSVSVAELPEPLEGREALIAALARARALGQKPRFRADAVDVTVEGNRARVNADLVAALEQATIAPRHAVALFEKRDGRFQLVSAEIGPTRRDEPEARP
jgi:hypothetical protein